MAGNYDKAMGKTKRILGKATGNRSLKHEGTAQEFLGKGEKAIQRGADKIAATKYRREHAIRPKRKI